MRAIVWDGSLHVADDVDVRAPEPHEVRVRIHNAGLCHSDISVLDRTIPFPTPVVLGHEGAGVVEEIGSAVRKVKPATTSCSPPSATAANAPRATGVSPPCAATPSAACRDRSPGRASPPSSSPTPACSPSRPW